MQHIANTAAAARQALNRQNNGTKFPTYGSSAEPYDGRDLRLNGITGAVVIPAPRGTMAGKCASMRDSAGRETTINLDKGQAILTHIAFVNSDDGIMRTVIVTDPSVPDHTNALEEFKKENEGASSQIVYVDKFENIAQAIKDLKPKNVDLNLLENLKGAENKMHFFSSAQTGFPMFMNANGERDTHRNWYFGKKFEGIAEDFHQKRFEQLAEEIKKSESDPSEQENKPQHVNLNIVKKEPSPAVRNNAAAGDVEPALNDGLSDEENAAIDRVAAKGRARAAAGNNGTPAARNNAAPKPPAPMSPFPPKPIAANAVGGDVNNIIAPDNNGERHAAEVKMDSPEDGIAPHGQAVGASPARNAFAAFGIYDNVDVPSETPASPRTAALPVALQKFNQYSHEIKKALVNFHVAIDKKHIEDADKFLDEAIDAYKKLQIVSESTEFTALNSDEKKNSPEILNEHRGNLLKASELCESAEQNSTNNGDGAVDRQGPQISLSLSEEVDIHDRVITGATDKAKSASEHSHTSSINERESSKECLDSVGSEPSENPSCPIQDNNGDRPRSDSSVSSSSESSEAPLNQTAEDRKASDAVTVLGEFIKNNNPKDLRPDQLRSEKFINKLKETVIKLSQSPDIYGNFREIANYLCGKYLEILDKKLESIPLNRGSLNPAASFSI